MRDVHLAAPTLRARRETPRLMLRRFPQVTPPQQSAHARYMDKCLIFMGGEGVVAETSHSATPLANNMANWPSVTFARPLIFAQPWEAHVAETFLPKHVVLHWYRPPPKL